MDGDAVELVIISHISHSLICEITGVPGAAGVPAVIPVEETSQGPGSVSKETVLRVTQAVLELVLRLKLVSTPTKVVIIICINTNN